MNKTLKTLAYLFVILTPSISFADTTNQIILMRHAAGEHTVQQVYNADPNHPLKFHLTEEGKKQAVKAAKAMKKQGIDQNTIQKVLVSPMPRTIETAEILAEQGVFPREMITIEPRLVEIQMGEREGHHFSEYKEHPWDHSDADVKYGGETYGAVQKRMVALYKEMASEHKAQKGHILMISHGTASKMLIDAVEGHAENILDTAGYKFLSLEKCVKCAAIN